MGLVKVQHSFTAGELDPLLTEREDVRWHALGADLIENFTVMPQGGLKRRGGLKHVLELTGLGTDPVKLVPFAFSVSQTYVHALTAGTDRIVMPANGLVSTEIVPYGNGDIATVNWTQSLDTLFLFHPDHPPHRIQRQGGDTIWDSAPQAFENIPPYDYGAGTGGVDEVQIIGLAGVSSGDTFVIELEGVATGTITAGASAAASATNIQTALRALANTSAAGITVSGSGASMTVTFGGDDGSRSWPLMVVKIHSGTGIPEVSRQVEGQEPGEDIISSTRGWPRCGTLYQGRLWLGGLRSRPQTILGSRSGSFFDFELGEEDDDALSITADTDDVSDVVNLMPGRRLEILTTGGEFFVNVEAITPTRVAISQPDANGSKEGVRAIRSEGATLFVQRLGSTLREYLYEEGEQNYVANPISLLSSHLINDPVAMTQRQARDTRESNLVVMVNGPTPAGRVEDLEGTITLLTTLRRQQVTAFSRMTTRSGDVFAAAAALVSGEVYVVTRRQIGGVTRCFLEQWDDALYVDCGVTITTGLPATTLVAAAPWLEGEEVTLVVDGAPAGTATVAAGGDVTLPYEASESVQIGLAFTCRARTLPFRPLDPQGQARRNRQKRVTEAHVTLYQAGGFYFGANGRDPRPITPRDMDDPILDTPPAPWSGTLEINGLLGWSRDAQVEIEVRDPVPFTLQSLSYEVAI